ncbi:hypothetical protein GIB67_006406 [Kingdonia uniflora]|uniref:Uncharacterized protein n=1 Tax=Kingdonia uniflora TaxID=39325 RepID=A0A7J7P123_9MAGN|nr:hypothetical protein GIB67_006406 [Kingdonia uniflora]
MAGPTSEPQKVAAADTDGDGHQTFYSRSEVPAPPANTAVGGKASLQPKRTPVSDREIESILHLMGFSLSVSLGTNIFMRRRGTLGVWVAASDHLFHGTETE